MSRSVLALLTHGGLHGRSLLASVESHAREAFVFFFFFFSLFFFFFFLFLYSFSSSSFSSCSSCFLNKQSGSRSFQHPCRVSRKGSFSWVHIWFLFFSSFFAFFIYFFFIFKNVLPFFLYIEFLRSLRRIYRCIPGQTRYIIYRRVPRFAVKNILRSRSFAVQHHFYMYIQRSNKQSTRSTSIIYVHEHTDNKRNFSKLACSISLVYGNRETKKSLFWICK